MHGCAAAWPAPSRSTSSSPSFRRGQLDAGAARSARERRGAGGARMRRHRATGGAAALLGPRASPRPRPRRPATSPMESSGCSRSPWPWRCKPRVLLLDEPAAGVPTARAARCCARRRAAGDVAVLLIEHDMDLVFRFAERISVLAEAPCWPKARRPRSRATRGARGLSGEEAAMADFGVEGLARRIGRGARAARRQPSSSPRAGARPARPQRRGQDHADQRADGRGAAACRAHHPGRRGVAPAPPERRAAAGLGWVPQERNIFRSLTVEENLTAVARPGRGRLARSTRSSPGWNSAAATSAASCRAASSRCWRSPAR